jgi:arylsulfatase
VHEGGIATPLIVHWPRGIAARGELRRDPGHLIDVVPTVLEIAGGPRSEEVLSPVAPSRPGKSLVAAFGGDGTLRRDDLWWEHEGNRAIRVGDWKLVASGSGPWELYDLAADRTETTNLATARPDKVQELSARWTGRRDEFAKVATDNTNSSPD